MKPVGKVELISYTRGVKDKDDEFVYRIEHNDGVTTLEQNLKLTAVEGLMHPNWTASMEFDGFAHQKTPQEAAMDYAKWLRRMADAIELGGYIQFTVADFVEINNEEA